MKEWPWESEERAELFLALQKAIVPSFDEGDWKELGYETGIIEWMGEHPRLLRSLHWNDPDYGGHVPMPSKCCGRRTLEASKSCLGEKILNRLRRDAPAVYARYVNDAGTVPDFEPQAISPSEAVLKALENARLLISTGDPIGAIDRVHTSPHAYLIEACRSQGILAKPDAGTTDLYKVLREQHPKLRDPSAKFNEVNKILRSLSVILDAEPAQKSREPSPSKRVPRDE